MIVVYLFGAVHAFVMSFTTGDPAWFSVGLGWLILAKVDD